MIYCVEDDDAIRELMIYSLKTAGFEARGLLTLKPFGQSLNKNYQTWFY